MNWKRWLLVAVVGGVIAVVGGPWVYINLIRAEAPAPLTSTTDEPTSGDADTTLESTDGSWSVAAGSVVGYRSMRCCSDRALRPSVARRK